MVTGPGDEAVGPEQKLLARALGALISMRRFDSPIHLARAIHAATLALAMFPDALPAGDAIRLRALRSKALEIALSVESPGISEADRDWLVATMRNVLGKAGEVALAENRLH